MAGGRRKGAGRKSPFPKDTEMKAMRLPVDQENELRAYALNLAKGLATYDELLEMCLTLAEGSQSDEWLAFKQRLPGHWANEIERGQTADMFDHIS